MNFDGAQIAAATGGTLVRDASAGPLGTDTRVPLPGGWFVALVGERFDAHDKLASLQEAVGLVVDRDVDTELGWVKVDDTTVALQDLGRAARDRLTGPVVGLTGSAGKTTTRALIALALSPLGAVHQTTGNLNNHLGVPMTLVAAPEAAKATVVEMGTSGPGEIAVLADIARPDIRLVLNIGASHLEELGGLDGVAREKGTLYDTARPGDACCVNLDDPRVAAMPLPEGVRRISFGRGDEADVQLLSAQVDPDTLHTQATLRVGAALLALDLPAPGVHLAHNAAAAVAVALAAGVDASEAVEALERYEPVGMRMKIERLPGGLTAFNDAYNANPSSMEASLRMFAGLPGRRVAVLGDMLELGGESDRFHDEIAELAVRLRLDRVLLVGPRMSRAAPDLDAGRVERAVDGTLLVAPLVDWLRPGDRLLFKGSRGAKVERILLSLRATLDPSREDS